MWLTRRQLDRLGRKMSGLMAADPYGYYEREHLWQRAVGLRLRYDRLLAAEG